MGFKIDFKALFGKASDYFFGLALTDPTAFHGGARPVLHGHSGGDIRKAQTLALQGLKEYLHVVRQHSDRFLQRYNDQVSYDAVRVRVAGKLTTPVGTAGGLDPDADGLEPLSYLFGFQIPGPVSAAPREFDEVPFQEDGGRGNLYVPPTFASRGLSIFLENVRQYRDRGGTAILLPSVTGVVTDSQRTSDAYQQLEQLLTALEPFVEGFVWSPLLAGSKELLQEAEFERHARLMARVAPAKLKLVELPAYEEDQRDAWLGLVRAFATHGGDGIVAVRGLAVPRSAVPRPDQWPCETALLCGADLASYRQRAIADARQAFPTAFIAACGGFHRRDEAFDACQQANVIVETEAFTRYGPGLARSLLGKLALRLRYLQNKGLTDAADLPAYQRQQWLQPEAGGIPH